METVHFPMLHTLSYVDGKYIATGWLHRKHEIREGDIIDSYAGKFKVVALLERRDHNGNFNNQDDKINSYFKVELMLIAGHRGRHVTANAKHF